MQGGGAADRVDDALVDLVVLRRVDLDHEIIPAPLELEQLRMQPPVLEHLAPEERPGPGRVEPPRLAQAPSVLDFEVDLSGGEAVQDQVHRMGLRPARAVHQLHPRGRKTVAQACRHGRGGGGGQYVVSGGERGGRFHGLTVGCI